MDFPDFSSLFHDYDSGVEVDFPSAIRISDGSTPHNLSLNMVGDDLGSSPFTEAHDLKPLRVSVGAHERTIPMEPIDFMQSRKRRYYPPKMKGAHRPECWPDPIRLESLSTKLLDNNEISRLWNEVALTSSEEIVVDALRPVVGMALDRIAVIGDRTRLHRAGGRRVVAKLEHMAKLVPLKRLGHGAQRLFGISLALANCRDGILIINEIENGIHHSIHQDIWRMIFRTAKEGNVQVFATTHSWDCIAGFAIAAGEVPANGTFYRLERVEDELHAIGYSEECLEVAAQQRVEVR